MDPRPIATLSIRRCISTLAIIALLLCIVGLGANLYIFQVAENQDTKIASLMQRFDLGFEPSLSSYFSSFLLLSCSIVLWLIYKSESGKDIKYRWCWLGLAIIFFGLSIDEAIQIHEMSDGALQQLWNTSGIFYLAWVIPGLMFVGVVGAIFFPFLIQLEPRTRTLFFIAAATFVGGAIGMEMVAALIIQDEGVASVSHAFVQTVEEGMEMAGSIVFLYALLCYLKSNEERLSIEFN